MAVNSSKHRVTSLLYKIQASRERERGDEYQCCCKATNGVDHYFINGDDITMIIKTMMGKVLILETAVMKNSQR